MAVALLLSLHVALAVNSLLQENATVDEVAHLPAGVTYWQKGTFKLYHHNPPLVKLVAALPVVASRPITDPLYPDGIVGEGVASDVRPVLRVVQRGSATSSFSTGPGC